MAIAAAAATLVTTPWTDPPAAIAESTRLTSMLDTTDPDRRAERTALASVLFDLLACQRAQDARRDDEQPLDYLRRVFTVYERRYATERTRHERHLRAKIAAVLTSAVVQPQVGVLSMIEVFFGSSTVNQVQAAISSLLGDSGAAAAGSPPTGFPSRQWADIMQRVAQWPHVRDAASGSSNAMVMLDTREKEILDRIVQDMHQELSGIVGTRTPTLAALDAALADQMRIGESQKQNYAYAQQALLTALSRIFARVPNAQWVAPTEDQYHAPASYTNERVANFDTAFRVWKQEIELAKRKLEAMQALVAAINDVIELPIIYGGSGTASKPFDTHTIKDAPAHLHAVFEMWASRYYNEPKERAAADLRSYKKAVETAMGAMVGVDRANNEVAEPLNRIIAYEPGGSGGSPSVAEIQSNVDEVRGRVAVAASEYVRHLETLRRLMITLHEVVRDATHAIDSSAVVPALDQLSDPAAHMRTVIAGKNAERVQRANKLKSLVAAVETAVTAIDPAIWDEQIDLAPVAVAAADAAAVAVAADAPAPASAPMTMTLRVAYEDIKQRTANLGTNANNEIATMFARSDGAAAASYVTLLQRVMSALLTHVQQRGVLIAKRAQQLFDNQETLYNLVRQAADVIFAGSDAARLPAKSDMTGLNGAIAARQRQRADARHKLFADLHRLLGAFRRVYEALDKPAAGAAADAAANAEAKAMLDHEADFFGPPSADPAQTVPNQAAFGSDNAVYEQHLAAVRTVVDRTQNIIYGFVERTKRADETLASSVESLYNSLRIGADAVFRGSDVGALPPKTDAQAVYNQIALRVETRKRERDNTFNRLAWYGLSFKQTLQYLGASARQMTTINEFVDYFWTRNGPTGEYRINGPAHANRIAFLSIDDNSAYEGKLSELSTMVDRYTSILYDLVRQRQAGEHNLAFIDTLHSLLRQGVDAVYDGPDPHPYPSKADAHLLPSTVAERARQRVGALEQLFDRLAAYVESAYRIVAALDPTIPAEHASLPAADPLAAPDVSRVVGSERQQLVVFSHRLLALRSFFGTAGNRTVFAAGGAEFDAWLTRMRDLVANAMQAAIATLAHRERETEVKIDKLDLAYTLLRTGADAIYHGPGTPAFVSRDELALLPAQIEQRVRLRNEQRDREFETVAYTLGALSTIVNALGAHGIGQQVSTLHSVTDTYIDISTGRVNETTRDEFRVTESRARYIKMIEEAITAAQSQVYAMRDAADRETSQLVAAMEQAYSVLSEVSAQMSAAPALPSLRTVWQGAAGGAQLLSVVHERIVAYENKVGTTRRALGEIIAALARVVDALGLGAYTMSKSELFEAAPVLMQHEVTTQFLGQYADDQVPLVVMMRYFQTLTAEAEPQLSNNTFSALRTVVERFIRSLNAHATRHLQLLAMNRDRGRTLAEQIEALAKSVAQQAAATFGRGTALPMLPGIEATLNLDRVMTESVRAEFEALGRRTANAWNQLVLVRAALYSSPSGSGGAGADRAMDVDLAAKASVKERAPGDWIKMYTDIYQPTKDVTASAFAALETAKADVETEARELATALANSKREYDQAERVVKEIERAVRSFDAGKTEIEMAQLRSSLQLAKQQARAALQAAGLRSIAEGVTKATTALQMSSIKADVDKHLEARRAKNADEKTNAQEMIAQARAIVQAIKSQTTDKLVQERIETFRNTLEAYRAAADAFTVTAIANRHGHLYMPFNALSMLYSATPLNDRGHPLTGGARSAFLCKRIYDLLHVLAVTPTTGVGATAPPSPFDGVPIEYFKPADDWSDLRLLFEQTVRVVQQTLAGYRFGDVESAATLFQRLLLSDVKADAIMMRLDFSDAAGVGGGGGGGPRSSIGNAITQSLVVRAWMDSKKPLYGHVIDDTELKAWTGDGSGNVSVPPGVVALFVFAFRLLVLASLAVPATLVHMRPDNFAYQEMGDTMLAVMVAREIERITRTQAGVRGAADVAHAAASDIRASLGNVATKQMLDRTLLTAHETLNTTTLAIPEVERGIVRSLFHPWPPLPVSDDGRGGGGGGGGAPPDHRDIDDDGVDDDVARGSRQLPRPPLDSPRRKLPSNGGGFMSTSTPERTAPAATSAASAEAAVMPVGMLLATGSPYSDNAF